MTKELRDLRIRKIALVRKSQYTPVNDGAVIEVVKAEEDKPMGQEGVKAPESGNPIARLMKAVRGVLSPEAVQKADGSHEDLHDRIDKALDQQYGGMRGYFPGHVVEHHDDHVITHNYDTDKHHKIPFTDDGEKAELGEPVEVERVFKPVKKAEADAAGSATHEPVQKAGEGAADERVSQLLTQMESVLDQLKAAQEKDAAIEKAIPTAEALAALVDERIGAALEPVAKAFEDYGIQQARRPLTPNVTAAISHEKNGGAGAAEKAKAVQGMTFSDAVKYLAHN